MTAHPGGPLGVLPYKLATLCDLRDRDGRVLLLRRIKPPNLGLCSPIGGKLDTVLGESPAQSARREIAEEAEVDIPLERLHLQGLIAEQSYEGKGHWLLFYFRVLGPVEVAPREMAEGRLEWHRLEDIEGLPLPESDRRYIWPLVRETEPTLERPTPGFFMLHLDCRTDPMTGRVEQVAGPR
ncbi:MAG: NUDIX domain-containing protein [Phycisphaeraceae bacterium]|nr:MAG: NUDIX domain-containing protein [Phycisphaeraceae bacterium]